MVSPLTLITPDKKTHDTACGRNTKGGGSGKKSKLLDRWRGGGSGKKSKLLDRWRLLICSAFSPKAFESGYSPIMFEVEGC